MNDIKETIKLIVWDNDRYGEKYMEYWSLKFQFLFSSLFETYYEVLRRLLK